MPVLYLTYSLKRDKCQNHSKNQNENENNHKNHCVVCETNYEFCVAKLGCGSGNRTWLTRLWAW